MKVSRARLSHVCAAIVSVAISTFAQVEVTHTDGVYVDRGGVLRWKDTKEEVRLFGVNYTTPFAYSYRAHTRLGLSLKEAIDMDVAHMARLGFDGFRVHVWDREISTKVGDIVENEHLDLFDYLLAQLAKRGIRSILTPIAWWGNGWPEPDEPTTGFSQSYSKAELITNPSAREAQRNYLRQFVQHTNPYRGISYKDDPSIIALEVINEPQHPESGEATRKYVDEMVQVLRSAGYEKPIFYNISENWSSTQANAVGRSMADGISFQWYPTGLVHGRRLEGNYLMHVSAYPIPSERVDGFRGKAKMVYEFDAADIGGSYMYPAMVRSFCEAGMQFAAMFSYDPVQIAWSNTEYPTHYLNLLYTPSKAISAMIAGRAFHHLPRLQPFGGFPQNDRFGDVLVSYERDLSELHTASEFIYSNTTMSMPQDAGSVRHVAGCGSSVLVRYEGTGAYFLDRLEPGIWRLEVYPDVLWIRDPFEVTSMSRQVARLFWRQRGIEITLPDLGNEYALSPLDGEVGRGRKEFRARHLVSPGVYLVSAQAADSIRREEFLSRRQSFLKGLYIPPPVSSGTYVVNRSPAATVESRGPEFRFQIASDRTIAGARLFVRRPGWRGWSEFWLKEAGGFDYTPGDTAQSMPTGLLEYCVAVKAGDTTYTFPDGVPGTPGVWDFKAERLWSMNVIPPGKPLALLDVGRDREDLVFPHYSKVMRYNVEYLQGSHGEEVSLAVKAMFSEVNATSFGVQLNVSERSKALGETMGRYRKLRIKVRSRREDSSAVSVVLVMDDGSSYAGRVELDSLWRERELSLSALRRTDPLMLPNAYPRFLPRTWTDVRPAASRQPDLRSLNAVQILVDPRYAAQGKPPLTVSFEIVSVTLTE